MQDKGSYQPATMVMKIGAFVIWLLNGFKGKYSEIVEKTNRNRLFLIGYLIYLSAITLIFFYFLLKTSG